MMDYLKDYNIDDDQINEIVFELKKNKVNVDLFKFDPEKIVSILDLFKEIGVTNFYDIIITSPSMFCDTFKSIKTRIDNYGDKSELARLINLDANNLIIADLMWFFKYDS